LVASTECDTFQRFRISWSSLIVGEKSPRDGIINHAIPLRFMNIQHPKHLEEIQNIIL